MVTYQFQIGDETWHAWKQTVPRTQTLDARLVELIEADTEGRVIEAEREHAPVREESEPVHEEPEPAPVEPPEGVNERKLRHALPTRGKSDEEIEQMIQAVYAAAELIRELGEAGQTVLERELYDEYVGPYGSETSWYKRCVFVGLEELADQDVGIGAPEGSGQPWRYVGEE